ncbi:MAG: hypothetical protein WCX74_02290 [Candidatus Paceibacterota bacterium]
MTYGFFFFLSLLLTLAVELPIIFFLVKILSKEKIRTKEILYWGSFASLFSIPYLWFIFPLFFSSHNYILIGEFLVVLIEAFIYVKGLKVSFKNAIVLSIVANIASYLLGLIILR